MRWRRKGGGIFALSKATVAEAERVALHRDWALDVAEGLDPISVTIEGGHGKPTTVTITGWEEPE